MRLHMQVCAGVRGSWCGCMSCMIRPPIIQGFLLKNESTLNLH